MIFKLVSEHSRLLGSRLHNYIDISGWKGKFGPSLIEPGVFILQVEDLAELRSLADLPGVESVQVEWMDAEPHLIQLRTTPIRAAMDLENAIDVTTHGSVERRFVEGHDRAWRDAIASIRYQRGMESYIKDPPGIITLDSAGS